MTSALKGFHIAASDSLEVVDKLTKVDMNAAASAGDIASMLRNYASTATLAGLDIDQAIAMGTTILDVSQKDSGSIGNALDRTRGEARECITWLKKQFSLIVLFYTLVFKSIISMLLGNPEVGNKGEFRRWLTNIF